MTDMHMYTSAGTRRWCQALVQQGGAAVIPVQQRGAAVLPVQVSPHPRALPQGEALLLPPTCSHPKNPKNLSSPASASHSRSLPCSPPTAIKGDSLCCGGCVPKRLEEKYVGACLVFSAFSAPNASDALIKHFPHCKRGLCSTARSPSTLQCNALDHLGNHRQAKNAVKVCKHQVLGESLCT